MKKASIGFIVLASAVLLSSCGQTSPSASSSSPASSTVSSEASSVPSSSSSTSSSAASSASSSQTLSSLVSSLKSNKKIESYVVSHNEKKVAAIRDVSSSTKELEIITVADQNAAVVTGITKDDLMTLVSPKWSFDDKYLSVDSGTDTVFSTYVINGTSAKNLVSFQTMKSVWSPSADSIATAAVDNNVKLTDQDTEITNSTEVKIYNASTLESRVVSKADPAYYTDIKSWTGSQLTLVHHYLSQSSSKDVTVSLKLTK